MQYLLSTWVYVFHARELGGSYHGQDMIRDIINHLSHGCGCVMLGGNLGWLTSDGLTG